jgi:hypothetical protein
VSQKIRKDFPGEEISIILSTGDGTLSALLSKALAVFGSVLFIVVSSKPCEKTISPLMMVFGVS